MKKWTALMLSLVLVLSLVACGQDTPTADPESGENPDKAETTLNGNSYWVLEESEGDVRESPPEGDDLLTDLTLWADGTARIREIENGIWLINDGDEQNMTWKQENGMLHLYTTYSGDEPYWSGVVTGEDIELNRFGGTFRFRQESMPEEGALYSPAELQGVWLQTGSEVEGYTEQSMPGRFESLVIQPDWNGDEQVLRASSEQGDYSGYVAFGTYYDQLITVLDEPVYEGCGNDVWSARIGEEAPKNENGYPEAGEAEIYVTLLDQNTLLQQQYFSIDGGPGVSYQTYQRVLPEASRGLEEADLEGGDFELACFTADDGTRQDAPPGISDFYLHLDVHGEQFFTATFDDGSEHSGSGQWILGEGGTLLLFNEKKSLDWPYEEQIDSEWFAGAVQSFNGIPEVCLWLEGGVMRLDHVEGSGGEWDGYVDTMDDIEGRAFSAPGDTLFVLYNQDYGDFADYSWLRTYDLSDGPEAQYLLLTSVEDGSHFWLEEDGYCREDFGTLDAGESIVIRLDIPADGGMNLQVSTQLGDYFFELSQSTLAFDGGWNYITT